MTGQHPCKAPAKQRLYPQQRVRGRIIINVDFSAVISIFKSSNKGSTNDNVSFMSMSPSDPG
jgi:hypothetical protein